MIAKSRMCFVSALAASGAFSSATGTLAKPRQSTYEAQGATPPQYAVASRCVEPRSSCCACSSRAACTSRLHARSIAFAHKVAIEPNAKDALPERSCDEAARVRPGAEALCAAVPDRRRQDVA